MNIRNKTWKSASLYSALFATLVATAPAFAAGHDDATLASNERAASAVIVGSTSATIATRSDVEPVTLTRNEHASQRAVVDVLANSGVALASTHDAKLSRNELAAQRVIADTSTPVVVVKAIRGQASLDSASESVSTAAR